MSTIYLFRHGQTFYNARKIFTGWKNAKLTELGVRQAKNMALLLREKSINIAYRSHLVRIRDTLDAVLKYHPECKQIIIDDRILERSYGKLEGCSHEVTARKFGKVQYELWHRDFFTRPPEGESYADVEIRVGKFIKDLQKQYSGKNLGIAISASSNSMRLFRKIMEDLTPEETPHLPDSVDTYFEYSI
ncbi:MAG: histidine phosphatase family protein [Candidatus Shapirobacteria bacterium]